MTKSAWLNCRAAPGLFSDECAVSGVDYQGEGCSKFVDRRWVAGEPAPLEGEAPARLAVRVLSQRDDLVLVLSPGRTFANGSTITVRDEQLANERPLASA